MLGDAAPYPHAAHRRDPRKALKRELLRAVDEAGPGLRHVVIDLLPVTSIDAPGWLTVTELGEVLNARGIGLNAAGRLTEWDIGAAEWGFGGYRIGVFPTLRQAVRELSSQAPPP